MPAVYRSQLDRDKQLGVFPGNMLIVHRNNQKALALLSLASRPLPNPANTRDVPAKFAQVLEGKFRNVEVLPSTKRDNLVFF